jgi:hypothetical protein
VFVYAYSVTLNSLNLNSCTFCHTKFTQLCCHTEFTQLEYMHILSY